jgi:hypothetical protein
LEFLFKFSNSRRENDFAGIAPNSHIKAIPAESNPHERAQPPDYSHIVLEPQPERHWRIGIAVFQSRKKNGASFTNGEGHNS